MVTTAFNITVTSEEPVKDYTEAADQLCEALRMSLATAEYAKQLTHTTDEIESGAVEVEVSQEPSGHAVALAVWQLEASKKIALDKTGLSTLLKDMLPFAVKVNKRAVTKDEMAAINFP